MKADLTLEQYWWTKETIRKLIVLTVPYGSVACLGAPSLGLAIPQKATILDIDSRLTSEKNFVYFDMKHPIKLHQTFDLIVADPPYSLVTGEELARAVEIVSYPETKLLVVDNKTGRGYVSNFIGRPLRRLFEVFYQDPQPESWHLWGDV